MTLNTTQVGQSTREAAQKIKRDCMQEAGITEGELLLYEDTSRSYVCNSWNKQIRKTKWLQIKTFISII